VDEITGLEVREERRPLVSRLARAGLFGRNRDYARFWLGESVSAIGTQITLLALPLLAVTELHATPGQMGLLGAAETAPFLLFALVFGALIERRRRRPILLAANAGRAVLLGLVPLLFALGVLSMGLLLVIAFAVGSCAVPFELAYQAYLPRLVDRSDLVEANSRLSASASVAEIGGPGLGGVLVGTLTAPVAILADALSFVVSVISLSGIRRAEPEPDASADTAGTTLVRQIREGVREMVRNRYLVAFVGEAATYNVAWNALNAMLVLWAVRDLGLTPATLGLLFSLGSVGSLLGALLTGPLARRIGVGRAMWTSAVVSNVGVLVIPTAGGGTAAVIGVLGFAFFLQTLGATATNVHTYAIRQAVTPDRLMGRTTAAYRTITHGTVPLGALLGGVLGALLGPHTAVAIAALALFPSWLWLYFSPARSLRDIPFDAHPAELATETVD
jgi:MFS family permease